MSGNGAMTIMRRIAGCRASIRKAQPPDRNEYIAAEAGNRDSKTCARPRGQRTLRISRVTISAFGLRANASKDSAAALNIANHQTQYPAEHCSRCRLQRLNQEARSNNAMPSK